MRDKVFLYASLLEIFRDRARHSNAEGCPPSLAPGLGGSPEYYSVSQ